MPGARYYALMYLVGRADSASRSFFSPTEPAGILEWTFEGLELGVKKRTFSQADPSHITYEIHLPSELLSSGTEFLLACVLYPTADIEANRAAFKRCLEELATKDSYEMSQHNA